MHLIYITKWTRALISHIVDSKFVFAIQYGALFGELTIAITSLGAECNVPIVKCGNSQWPTTDYTSNKTAEYIAWRKLTLCYLLYENQRFLVQSKMFINEYKYVCIDADANATTNVHWWLQLWHFKWAYEQVKEKTIAI